jgi:autotransporter-associated beta strand protein
VTGSETFAGTISDNIAVNKTGTATQIFSGANTYTGSTSVEGGRLVVASDAGLGATSAGTTVSSGGGTVELAGSSTSEPFTLEARGDDSTAHLDATGNSSSTITASGSVTLDDGTGADPANFNVTTNTTGTAVFNIGADIDGTGNTAGEQNLNFGGGADGEGVVSGAINMDAGATTNLNVGGDASWEFSGALNDVDNLNVSGGLTTLTGSDKTIGTVDVSGGTLDLGTGLTTANAVTVGVGAELTQTGSNIAASQSGGYDVDGTVSLNGSDATMTALTGGGIIQNNDDAGNNTNTLTIDTATTQAFAGTLRDGDGAGDDGILALTKSGSGTQVLSGSSTYTGETRVEAGALNIRSDDALGDAAAGTTVTGTGQVELQGGISVAEAFDLIGRADMGVHLENLADANTITSVALQDSDAGTDEDQHYTITSEGGTLTINDVDATGLTAGDNATLNLGGDSTAALGSTVTMDGAIDNLTKFGDSTWTVNNLEAADGTISSQGGVLALAGGADLTGNMVYEVLNEAELDVTALGSLDVAAVQQLRGDGLVDGDVVAATGSGLTAGQFDDIGELEVSGLLDLDGLLTVNVSGSSIDKLVIGGDFDITAGSLEFVLDGAISGNALVLATYGSLTGSEFASLSGVPNNYRVEYAWEGNQIALVANNPIPIPGPLALIGLGALIWGGLRRASTDHPMH